MLSSIYYRGKDIDIWKTYPPICLKLLIDNDFMHVDDSPYISGGRFASVILVSKLCPL